MNIEHINQLRQLISWVKNTTGKSANLEIDFWHHKVNEQPTIEYKVWVEGLFNQSTEDSGMLIALVPYIKDLCRPQLQEVA